MDRFPSIISLRAEDENGKEVFGQYKFPSGFPLSSSSLLECGGVEISSVDINEYLQYWELNEKSGSPYVVDYLDIGGTTTNGDLFEPDFMYRVSMLTQVTFSDIEKVTSIHIQSDRKVEYEDIRHSVVINGDIIAAQFYDSNHAIATARAISETFGGVRVEVI
jgi:hypothetical protein